MCTCEFINARHSPDCETRNSMKPSFTPTDPLWQAGYRSGYVNGYNDGKRDTEYLLRKKPRRKRK